METVSQAKLDDMLRKVQALLARADHPNTPVPEAESCRSKAELLMWKYKIDETAAAAQGMVHGFTPEWHTFTICSANSEFRSIYRSMAAVVVDHVGARAVYRQANIDGQYVDTCELVGYPSDVRMADMLYTSCMLAFQSKLEPKYDPNLSDQENAYNMRSAGMEGIRIAGALYNRTLRADRLTSEEKGLCRKARALFKKEAERRGEDPAVLLGIGNNVKTFRESYAKGFEYEIWQRLKFMRSARGAESTGLVLANRDEAIAEAFYAKFPNLKPKPVSGAIAWTDPSADCKKCAAAKSGYCREHSYLRPRASTANGPKLNHTAYYRGKDAAAQADLGRSGVTPKFNSNAASPKELD